MLLLSGGDSESAPRGILGGKCVFPVTQTRGVRFDLPTSQSDSSASSSGSSSGSEGSSDESCEEEAATTTADAAVSQLAPAQKTSDTFATQAEAAGAPSPPSPAAQPQAGRISDLEPPIFEDYMNDEDEDYLLDDSSPPVAASSSKNGTGSDKQSSAPTKEKLAADTAALELKAISVLLSKLAAQNSPDKKRQASAGSATTPHQSRKRSGREPLSESDLTDDDDLERGYKGINNKKSSRTTQAPSKVQKKSVEVSDPESEPERKFASASGVAGKTSKQRKLQQQQLFGGGVDSDLSDNDDDCDDYGKLKIELTRQRQILTQLTKVAKLESQLKRHSRAAAGKTPPARQKAGGASKR